MKPNPKTSKSVTLAALLLSGVAVLGVHWANAQTGSPPAATATRPEKRPVDQTSIPNNAPPATTTQPTGEAGRDPTIKKMNEDEKAKVDTKGK
jgi:hypothetical protein